MSKCLCLTNLCYDFKETIKIIIQTMQTDKIKRVINSTFITNHDLL